MDKSVLKTISKCIFFGIVWAILLFVIAMVITNTKGYNFKNVLFTVGILMAVAGCLSAVGGNPLGLSMHGLGQEHTQCIPNANLEITKMEKEKTKNVKSYIRLGLSTISFITGAVLIVIVSFII